MVLNEQPVSSTRHFTGRVIGLRVDQVRIGDGSLRTREVVEHPGGVSVAVLTPDNDLLMVRQFRYGPGEVLLELPAGKLEPGEVPFDAMRREQREETGTVSDHYLSLGKIYPTPGYDTEVIYLWACRATGWGAQDLDNGELLHVERIPLSEAVELVLAGELPDAKTQIGILKTDALVREGKL